MRRLPSALLVVLAGCSFDRSGLGAPDAFVDPEDDGGGVPSVWIDDTLIDFANAGYALDDARLEPWGAVGPAAYLTGALVTRADDSQLFTTLDGDPWPLLEGSSDDGWGTTFLAGQDWGFDGPRGMNLSSFDSYTYWAWGEIWLDEGAHTWTLAGDDLAFLDLAAPRSETYTRVVVAEFDEPGVGAYNVTTAGWHGVRLAMTEGIGESELTLLLQAPGEAAPGPIAPDRLRTRVDDLVGFHWTGFEDSRLLAPLPTLGPFLWRAPVIDYDPSNGDVTGLGFLEADRFSMRWAGQVRIDVPGAYRFRVDSDDGQRLWIDGVVHLDFWDDSPHDETTAPIELDVGWHDVVLDLTDNTGGQDINLLVVEGPDEALTAELPLERVRPAAPRHERTIGAVRTGGTIPAEGEVSLDVRLGAPDGAVTTAIELGVTITHGFWVELGITVVAPDGSEYVALPVGGITGGGTRTERFTVPVPGETARGIWAIKVQDTVANDGGTIDGAELTVRYDGGTPPIAEVAAYESPVEDLGAVVGFDAVTWTGRFPEGTSAQVRFRTCDEPDGCATQDWSAPAGLGDKPAVLGRRHAQYRIELLSDGDAVPYLDAIEIAYRASL